VLFKSDFLGSTFLNLPEVKNITRLLETAKLGLKIQGETRRKVSKIAEEMIVGSSGKRLIGLLSALELIAASKEYEYISSNGFNREVNGVDQSRINSIFEYTFNNFHHKIALEDVAALLTMGKHSFCRYFKSKTQKTYVQFLMEVRIGHACRLLVEDEYNIGEIGYACGYNNISHFYHQFKSITNKNPLDYRNAYLSAKSPLSVL